ncbi:hypothetical protein GBF38_012618 [Nibea albiflora]|uniref:Uncharacterized protein n=1 Tax=Nibea albiflora TaxID=240163 RepID=A0ACB7EK77_NIBAL|nr:hypothetical protein GBF38_012618 [Nibea albiflora]
MRRTDPPGQIWTGEQQPGVERIQSGSGKKVGPEDCVRDQFKAAGNHLSVIFPVVKLAIIDPSPAVFTMRTLSPVVVLVWPIPVPTSASPAVSPASCGPENLVVQSSSNKLAAQLTVLTSHKSSAVITRCVI